MRGDNRMKYIAPEADVTLLWDDPLLQSQGGQITLPEDSFG